MSNELKVAILERNSNVYTDIVMNMNFKMEVIRDILDFHSRKDGLKLLLIELVLDENIEEIKKARQEIELTHNARLNSVDLIHRDACYYTTADLSYTREQYYEINNLYKERIDLIDMVLAHYGVKIEPMNKTDAFMEYALIEEKATRIKVSKMLQDKD